MTYDPHGILTVELDEGELASIDGNLMAALVVDPPAEGSLPGAAIESSYSTAAIIDGVLQMANREAQALENWMRSGIAQKYQIGYFADAQGKLRSAMETAGVPPLGDPLDRG